MEDTSTHETKRHRLDEAAPPHEEETLRVAPAAAGVQEEGQEERYTTELQPMDVLLGRGSGPNDHVGNVHFRNLVSERKAEYMATNHRQTKAKIAREIVDRILAKRGRFLKKLGHREVEALRMPHLGPVVYKVVSDDDTLLEKAKQALRQNASRMRSEAEEEAGAAGAARSEPRQGTPPPPSETQSPKVEIQGVLDLEPLPLSRDPTDETMPSFTI
jgi:hypothetical protein